MNNLYNSCVQALHLFIRTIKIAFYRIMATMQKNAIQWFYQIKTFIVAFFIGTLSYNLK